MTKTSAVQNLNDAQVSNGAAATIDQSRPYFADITVVGLVPILMHAWNVEAVASKASAAKGSKAKKTDDLESYVRRTPKGYIGIPGENFHGSIINAARYHQDPRSPRKSMADLCRAAILPLTTVAPFEPATKQWDYEDKHRVVVQRNAITRVRPAMREGWKLTFTLLVTLPEYVPPEKLNALVIDAGRLAGLSDHRPTYGRFGIANFTVRQDELNGTGKAKG